MKNNAMDRKHTSMVDIHPTILIIILTVNGLNTIKKQRLWEFIKEQHLTICCL